jgi:ribonuclease HII
MDQQEVLYPGYSFYANKGYATRDHMDALKRLGPCELHRRSFAPVRDMLAPAAVQSGAISQEDACRT